MPSMIPQSMRRRLAIAAGAVALALTAAAFGGTDAARGGWSEEEWTTVRSMWLATQDALAPDVSNRHADDPRAVALGHRFFFETRFSSNGKVACATCHLVDRDLQDGVALASGVGRTARRTMPVAGTQHGQWFFWDGRADSQWAQALGPLESPVEHGGDRTQYAHVVAAHHRDEYEAVFGPLPELRGLPAHAGPVADSAASAAWARLDASRREAVTRVFVNIGKAIAAYERRLDHAPSRFDRWVAAVERGAKPAGDASLTRDEEAGLRLFVGKANCINCHNGPQLSDGHFHNTGVPASAEVPAADSGRATGARQAVTGEFACTSRWSDAPESACTELKFAVTEGEELVRAYKTPSLRAVARRAPFMHAGQMATLTEVIAHYDRAPDAPAGHSELRPLRLSAKERRQLEAFLGTLDGGIAAPAALLAAPAPR